MCFLLLYGSLDNKFNLEADDNTGSIKMTAREKVSPTMHALTEDIYPSHRVSCSGQRYAQQFETAETEATA